MRALSGLALLSIAIVACVVLFSGQNDLQSALKPLERTPSAAVAAHSASPMLAQRLTIDQTFNDLYVSARLAYAASGDSLSAIKQELEQDNPSAKVDQPLGQGGIAVRLVGHGQVLELCALTGQGYHCDDQQLTGSGQNYGNGATLATARRQAKG